jgi:membrane protein
MEIRGYRLGPLLKRTGSEIMDDNVLGVAAQVAYYFFFSLFPIFLFLAPLLAIVGDKQKTFTFLLDQLAGAVPGDAFALVQDVVKEVVFSDSAPGVVSVGALLALWSGSNVFSALQDALNTAYDVEKDERPWWKKKLIALACLLGVGLLFVVSTVILLSGDDIVGWVGDRIGLGAAARFTWNLVQFPLAVGLLVTTGFIVFKFLPAVRQRNAHVWVASLTTTVLWLVATLLFRFYVQNFGSYNKTYGAIGAVIVLLTWMYLSMVVVLIGGELAAELMKGTGGVRSRAGHLYDGRISTGGSHRPAERRGGGPHAAQARAVAGRPAGAAVPAGGRRARLTRARRRALGAAAQHHARAPRDARARGPRSRRAPRPPAAPWSRRAPPARPAPRRRRRGARRARARPPPAAPPGACAVGPATRFVTAFPNRSTAITHPSMPPSASRRASGVRRTTGSSRGVPNESSAAPSASRAAAGANTSRPWKVGAARGGTGRRTARAPASNSAGESTPLSGPTSSRPSLSTASAARAEPTPGSTTARWTVPRGKRRQYRARASRAPSTSCGATSCVASTICAPGASVASTALSSAT